MIAQAQLNEIAKDLSRNPAATVLCQSWAGIDPQVHAYVMPNPDHWMINPDDPNGDMIVNPDVPLFFPIIHLPFATCQRLFVLDKRRNQHPIGYYTLGVHTIARNEGEDLESIAHEAEHIMSESSDESYVECWAYDHRLRTIKVFLKYMKLAPWYVTELIWGMKNMHQETPDEYRRNC